MLAPLALRQPPEILEGTTADKTHVDFDGPKSIVNSRTASERMEARETSGHLLTPAHL
jgi:hypothetical protein